MKRSGIKRKPAGPDFLTVEKVLKRDGWCCVACGMELIGERAIDWSIHHRRGRDGRPDSHRPQNLISVCGADNFTGCHGRIHQRRSESRPNGWSLSRVAGEDPLVVPVLVEAGSRFVYLTASGEYSDEPPEVTSSAS